MSKPSSANKFRFRLRIGAGVLSVFTLALTCIGIGELVNMNIFSGSQGSYISAALNFLASTAKLFHFSNLTLIGVGVLIGVCGWIGLTVLHYVISQESFKRTLVWEPYYRFIPFLSFIKALSKDDMKDSATIYNARKKIMQSYIVCVRLTRWELLIANIC